MSAYMNGLLTGLRNEESSVGRVFFRSCLVIGGRILRVFRKHSLHIALSPPLVRHPCPRRRR